MTDATLGNGLHAFGLACVVLTRTLARKVRAGLLPAANLQLLSRCQLRELTRSVAATSGPEICSVLMPLAAILAFGHDADAESSPIKSTLMALVYEDNGWQNNICKALLFEPEEASITDLLGNISVQGLSETDQIAKFFGMTVEEMARQTTGLSSCWVFEARTLASEWAETYELDIDYRRERMVLNWDTMCVNENLVWAVSRQTAALSPWRGKHSLTLCMPFTCGKGYRKGETPGQWRMLELGATRVVRWLEFTFVLTTRIPSESDAALASLADAFEQARSLPVHKRCGVRARLLAWW